MSFLEVDVQEVNGAGGLLYAELPWHSLVGFDDPVNAQRSSSTQESNVQKTFVVNLRESLSLEEESDVLEQASDVEAGKI